MIDYFFIYTDNDKPLGSKKMKDIVGEKPRLVHSKKVIDLTSAKDLLLMISDCIGSGTRVFQVTNVYCTGWEKMIENTLSDYKKNISSKTFIRI